MSTEHDAKPEAAIRVIRPTRSLLEGCEYRNAASTDLKKRFDEIRAEALDFGGPTLRELKARRKK